MRLLNSFSFSAKSVFWVALSLTSFRAFAESKVLTWNEATSKNINLEISSKTDSSILSPNLSPLDRVLDQYFFNFGQVRIHFTDYVRFNLTNTGTTQMTFQRATIAGIGFDAVHTCTGVLQPGQACYFEVSFSPWSKGFQSGRFVISFAEDLDILVDLMGTGY